jgi:AcrR family transcriptional regulator
MKPTRAAANPQRTPKQPTKRGRPRAFDPDHALDAALRVFWEKGYEGASLPDLTHAMGINRPSLYAAFGNKQSLFKKALDRYAAGPACYVTHALEAPTARAVFEQLLSGAIDLLTCPDNPRGCLAVQGALACGDDAQPARRDLVSLRAAAETALKQRLTRARTAGDLPKGANPADLARYAATVLHGLAIQAASGATRPQLRRVATLALRAWPT